jgi:ribose-phosphate pyrophosphokinase
VLSGGAAARNADSMLDEVVVTETIPLRDDAHKCGNIRQLSTAPLLADTFTRIVKGESIMELFAE